MRFGAEKSTSHIIPIRNRLVQRTALFILNSVLAGTPADLGEKIVIIIIICLPCYSHNSQNIKRAMRVFAKLYLLTVPAGPCGRSQLLHKLTDEKRTRDVRTIKISIFLSNRF